MVDISLHLLVIRSLDIDRAAKFYAALGMRLEQHRHGKGPLHYTANLGAAVFEIYPRANETDSTASVRIGFQVVSVEAAVRALQDVGGRVVSVPQVSEWGQRAVVEDFDEHRIELTETTSP